MKDNQNQYTKDYTQDERDNALALMAAHHGSRDKASEITGIPANTLSSWAYNTYAEKYRELRHKAKTQIQEATLETMLRRAEEAGRDADVVRARMMLPENLAEIPVRELSSNYRNLLVGAGIYLTNAAKMIEASNQNAGIQINFSLGELLNSFKSKGVRVYNAPEGGEEIEGEAKEIEEESK